MCTPGGHAQHDATGAGVQPADVGEARLHAERGAGGALGVIGAGEEEEQRVAAELQQAAAGLVRDLEQRLEAGADRVGHLFGADLAVAGEPLGHLGEAGDVDEEQRAVDRPGRSASGARSAQSMVRRGTYGSSVVYESSAFTAVTAGAPASRHLGSRSTHCPVSPPGSLPAGNEASATNVGG